MVLYYCEKCGKAVEEKYGSGRFCSKACANSRFFSEETNLKRKESNREAAKKLWENQEYRDKMLSTLNEARSHRTFKKKDRVFGNCAFCGKKIDITDKKRSSNRYFCNGTCRNKLLNSTKEIGGLFKGYNVSHWELVFRDVLTKYNIKFEANKRNLIPSRLEIDIWLPDQKMAIELNGIFHYSTKPYKGDEEALRRKQEKDALKKAEVLALGYKFFVIEDRDVDCEYEQFFENFLRKNLVI